jgi:hypothetical protein
MSFRLHLPDGRDFEVSFSYETYERVRNDFVMISDTKSSITPNALVTTRCWITAIHPNETQKEKKYEYFDQGEVSQDSRDKFDKKKGRRLALAKALLNCGSFFTKEDRRLFWEKYFAHMNDVKMSNEQYRKCFPLKGPVQIEISDTVHTPSNGPIHNILDNATYVKADETDTDHIKIKE